MTKKNINNFELLRPIIIAIKAAIKDIILLNSYEAQKSHKNNAPFIHHTIQYEIFTVLFIIYHYIIDIFNNKLYDINNKKGSDYL